MSPSIESNSFKSDVVCQILNSIEILHNFILRENFIGWDPYDALNSSLVRKICRDIPLMEIIAIQANKYSPINFRRLLGIEKTIDTKCIALLINAYSKLFSILDQDQYSSCLRILIPILIRNSLKEKYGFHCWSGHSFRYTSSDGLRVSPDEPDIVTTANSIIALTRAYVILRDPLLKEVAYDASRCLLQNFTKEADKENLYFKYYMHSDNKIVYNASSHGLEAISSILKLNPDSEWINILERVALFLISSQRLDGSWAYSIYENNRIRNQLDFHQGFIIDGLIAYYPYARNKELLLNAIKKGACFYEKMFYDGSRSHYRFPRKIPTDIHNQAQGIITFSKLYSFLKLNGYLEKSLNIALWTIDNMQDQEKGYFYYQKWPLLTNKIPYMRWAQAWMLLALAQLTGVLMERVKCEF